MDREIFCDAIRWWIYEKNGVYCLAADNFIAHTPSTNIIDIVHGRNYRDPNNPKIDLVFGKYVILGDGQITILKAIHPKFRRTIPDYTPRDPDPMRYFIPQIPLSSVESREVFLKYIWTEGVPQRLPYFKNKKAMNRMNEVFEFLSYNEL